jgi:hypothetical protein
VGCVGITATAGSHVVESGQDSIGS